MITFASAFYPPLPSPSPSLQIHFFTSIMDFPTLPEAAFNTQEGAYAYAQGGARGRIFAVAVGHGAPRRDRYYYSCDGGSCRCTAVGIRVPGYYYGCDGGLYRRAAVGIRVPEKLRKCQRTSRQLDCPYSLYIRCKRKQGWVVTERNGSHNRIPSLHQSVHSRVYTADLERRK